MPALNEGGLEFSYPAELRALGTYILCAMGAKKGGRGESKCEGDLADDRDHMAVTKRKGGVQG